MMMMMMTTTRMLVLMKITIKHKNTYRICPNSLCVKCVKGKKNENYIEASIDKKKTSTHAIWPNRASLKTRPSPATNVTLSDHDEN